MRPRWISGLALLAIAASLYGQGAKTTNTVASVPKGAEHLTVKSDSEARKIFTFFPYPPIVTSTEGTGVYRLDVNPQGSVTAVTILKSLGSDEDSSAMKTFARWRARPGSLRIVDVGWHLGVVHRVISR